MAVDYQPPQSLSKPIEVPSKLLMGAGPSNAAESVLRAGSLPLLGHLHTEFVEVPKTIKFMFRWSFTLSVINVNIN